jgi:hypothetical protein
MVSGSVRKIQYKIEFVNKVDWFDVILQKQIELRKKFVKCDENHVVIIELDNCKKFLNSDFMNKYSWIYIDPYSFDFSFLKLNNSPDKYKLIRQLFNKINYDKGDIFCNIENLSYEEFEHKIDHMLEEFKLFLDKYEFDEDTKKIIEAFTLDEKIKSNIKFIGWTDNIVNW